MSLRRFKGGEASVLTIALIGLLATCGNVRAAGPADVSWIDRRILDWELSQEERRFDEIGWAGDLVAAEPLAREQNRPLFVFTYSGSATEDNAIALRRC